MPSSPHPLIEATLRKLKGAYADKTLKLYQDDFTRFALFCEIHGFHPLPASPEALVAYIAELTEEGYAPGGIRRILYSLSNLHRLHQLENPTQTPEVEIAIKRMHRLLGRAARQAQGIRENDIDVMSRACPDTLRGFRNRVLIRVGYDTLSRAGELVSINAEHVTSQRIWLPRSKTDQDGRGSWLYLSGEGDRLLTEWLRIMGMSSGAIFTGLDPLGRPKQRLHESEVTRILKQLARATGLDARTISGHSLRVGGAQSDGPFELDRG